MTDRLYRNHRGYGRFIGPLLTIADFAIVNILFWAALKLVPTFCPASSLREVWLLVNVALLPVPLWQSKMQDITSRAISMDQIALEAVKAVIYHALFFLSMMLFIGNIKLSAKFYIYFYAMLLPAMPLCWLFTRRMLKWFRSHGRNYTRIVIVGTNQTAQRLAAQMRSDAGFGYQILGFFADERPAGFPEKYLGSIDMLDSYVRSEGVDEIFFTLAGEYHSELRHVVKVADDNIIPFYYVPQISKYVSRNFSLHSIAAMPVLSLRRNPLKSHVNRMLKRAFDLAFSSVVLLCSPIIFIPVALGVKLSSPGPIFFRQQRTGYRGRSFGCYKFRTMRVNAQSDSIQATQDDPRKTRFGDFLRRTSIDELPQFINVWLGQMSVVGPRPHMLKHTDQYTRLIDMYMVRHAVKPGITGWAQVNGYRGATDEVWKMERRVEHDVWYIEHWNFMLDLKIIVRTIFNALGGEKNAY